jgi:hypothetical protein
MIIWLEKNINTQHLGGSEDTVEMALRLIICGILTYYTIT